MKFPRVSADISGDMDQSEPGKTSPTPSRAERTRDQIVAADAACVADWVDAVVRTIAARRVHLLDASTLGKIHTDLEGATRSCLNQVGDVTIRVEELDLSFEGLCIYHSAARAGSLSVALYREGLREISIRIGLEPDELRAFVDILDRATAGSDEESEDVVTLLWEASFPHIGYVCAPPEEWEAEPRGEGGEFESHAGDRGIPWAMNPSAEEETIPDPDGLAQGRSDDWSLAVEEPSNSSKTPSAQFDLTEVEVYNICMLASIEAALSPRDRILEILFAALAIEENPAEFLDIALSLGCLVEQAAVEGDLQGANHLIDRLRGITNSKTASSELESATDQVLKHIGRSEFLGRIAKLLSRRPDIDLDALTQFMAQMGPSAAPTLCDILGEIEEMKIRRAICEALVISCKNHVGILIDRLSDPRWYLVRNILYVLGRIAHQGVERALGDTLSHADIRVRKEAVRALAEIESPTSRAYLNSALRDPDKAIRILVARLLARKKDDRAARIIWSVIESPEFAGRDVDERVAFCEALGRSGSDALIPKMEGILTRGGLFKSANQEGRMEAAMALAWLGTPAALEVLSREERSKNDTIRRAVTEALQTMRKFAPEGQRKS